AAPLGHLTSLGTPRKTAARALARSTHHQWVCAPAARHAGEKLCLELLQAMEKGLKTRVLGIQLLEPVDGVQRVLLEAAIRLVRGDADGLQLLRELRGDALSQHGAKKPFVTARQLKMVLGMPDPQVGRLLQED